MAVDTRDRRGSCLSIARQPSVVFPNPDGSLANQPDRAFMAYGYPGIATVAVVVPTTPGIEFTLLENRHHYDLPENRLHYDLPENRLHFTLPEQDR
jgi:hypothetical protein